MSVAAGRNPYLTLLSADEIFHGAFDPSSRLPILGRLTVSTGQADILLSGGGLPTYGVGAVAADDANVYIVQSGPQSAELQRLARVPGAVPVALDTTARQPPQTFVGNVAIVGGEIFYSLFGTFAGGTVGKPAGLYAVDRMGGTPRPVIEAASGRGLRVLGDSLFFAYLGDTVADPTKSNNATLVRIPMSGGAPEILAAGVAPSQFEVDAAGVYWVEANKLMTMPWRGGPAREIFSPPSLGAYPQVQTFLGSQFVLAEGYAYASVNNVGSSATLVKTELLRIPLDGGPGRVLYQSVQFNDLAQLGVLGDSIYFPLDAPDPKIMKVPRCGCGSALIGMVPKPTRLSSN